jgi:hypothetical protein
LFPSDHLFTVPTCRVHCSCASLEKALHEGLVPSDHLFTVPTCRVHCSCASLEKGLLILFSPCPKFIVVKTLMCSTCWFFCRNGLPLYSLRDAYEISLQMYWEENYGRLNPWRWQQ